MRRFLLKRDEDVSNFSGTGYVAEGIEFWDGTCALHWRTSVNSSTIYRTAEDLLAIHSHEGKTTIEWIDIFHTHRQQCIAIQKDGTQCKFLALTPSLYCKVHSGLGWIQEPDDPKPLRRIDVP